MTHDLDAARGFEQIEQEEPPELRIDRNGQRVTIRPECQVIRRETRGQNLWLWWPDQKSAALSSFEGPALESGCAARDETLTIRCEHGVRRPR
jgi:hypothetical protein